MRVNWKEVCKFLAGASFVDAGILFYLYLTNTSVPVLETHFVVDPQTNGLRSIAHFAFFLLAFMLALSARDAGSSQSDDGAAKRQRHCINTVQIHAASGATKFMRIKNASSE
jgi:hypothetical protein